MKYSDGKGGGMGMRGEKGEGKRGQEKKTISTNGRL